MRNISKVLVLVAVVAAAAIVATVFRLGKGGGSGPVVAPTNEERTTSTPQFANVNSTSTPRTIIRRTSTPMPNPTGSQATNENPMPPKTTPGLIANWDDKVNDILGAEGDEKDKAQKLIEMFPHLPPDGQEEVAHHISNLVADEDYAPLSKFVTNSALPEAVLDVFVEDVFNRPNSIKLPLLLDIAQDPQHPRAAEAKDVLELFLEEDFGSDWTKWHAKMDQWLKDNPD